MPHHALIRTCGSVKQGQKTFQTKEMEDLDVDQGWAWMVLMAAFICNVLVDGIMNTFGIFYPEFLEHFGGNTAQLAWVGAVPVGIQGAMAPVASMLGNRFGFRTVAMCGGLLSSISLLLSTFTSNATTLIITYGALTGVGFSFIYTSSHVVLAFYFERKRAVAMGVASCGTGVGTFAFPPLCSYGIKAFGWRGTIWILAGIALHAVVCGALFRPIKQHQSPVNKTAKATPRLDIKLFRNVGFLLLCLSTFSCMIGFLVPLYYLPEHVLRLEVANLTDSAFLLSLFGITNTVSRVLLGWLADRSFADPLCIYCCLLIIGGIVTALVPHMQSYTVFALYTSAYGICMAVAVSLFPILLLDAVHLEAFPTATGMAYCFRGVACVIGITVTGKLVSSVYGFYQACYVAGAMITFSGLTPVFIYCLRVFKRIKAVRENESESRSGKDETWNSRSEDMSVIVTTDEKSCSIWREMDLDSTVELDRTPVNIKRHVRGDR